MSRATDNSDKKTLAPVLAGGGLVLGAALAGYTAGRVTSIRNGLSEEPRPFVWNPPRGGTVLLKNVDVVDVKRGQLLRNRGILVRDGQILDLVATRDLESVTADRVFDCGGLVAMPGLINCHTHMVMPCAAMPSLDLVLSVKRQALRNLEECARHGVTTVRDAAGLPLVLNDLARKIEGLQKLGPRVVSCGPAIGVKGGYPDHLAPLPGWLASRYGQPIIQVTGPDSAREAVRASVEQGGRWIKLFFDDRSLFFSRKPLNTLDDASVKAIVDEAHRLGRRVGVHQSQLTGFRRAVKLGVDDLEHIPMDKEFTDRDIESFMKEPHHITPTAAVSMALGIAAPGHPARSNAFVEAMQDARDRLLYQISPSVSEAAVLRSNEKMVRFYEEEIPAGKTPGAYMFDNEMFIEAVVESRPNITKLYEAGAKLCCGNDGGTPLSFPAILTVEMQIFERLGISRVDILRSATINAAGLVDLEKELGSIEPGKLADIVLLSGDPLKDIRAVERTEAVFRGGVLLHHGPGFPLESATT